MAIGLMVGAGLGAASGIMGAIGGSKAEGAAIDAQRQQKIEIVKQMNWGDAKTRLDIKSQWDTATADLSDMNMQAIRNRTTMAAGISESGMEGRTTRAVQRAVEGQDLRSQSRLKENYDRDYTSLLSKREEDWQGGLAAIRGQQKVQTSSGLSQAFGILNSTVSGGMMGNSLQTAIQTPKGVKK